MKILFLTNAPVPKNRHTDAHFQELDLLVKEFNGEIISTFPLSRPTSLLPRFMYGMHNRFEIKKAIKKADIIHVFSPVLHPFRYLKYIVRKPLIYSAMTPIQRVYSIKHVKHFIVYDQTSMDTLSTHHVENVSVSPPFVDFSKQTLNRPDPPFTIMMASAPWEKSQFESKGVYLLLEVLSRIKDLHITFIWRDVLFEDIQKLVNFSSFADRIKLINGRVDIQKHLSTSHAVVLLAKDANLVKAYPHSLMEGMLAGRPVLTSPTIPISKEIREKNYGQVLRSFDVDALEDAIRDLRKNYATHVDELTKLPEDHFGKQAFLDFHRGIYDHVVDR